MVVIWAQAPSDRLASMLEGTICPVAQVLGSSVQAPLCRGPGLAGMHEDWGRTGSGRAHAPVERPMASLAQGTMIYQRRMPKSKRVATTALVAVAHLAQVRQRLGP